MNVSMVWSQRRAGLEDERGRAGRGSVLPSSSCALYLSMIAKTNPRAGNEEGPSRRILTSKWFGQGEARWI